ncbi:MAG TPA: IscS subfamily cysteine desulfurase [Candidatus Saccharimonadales bacterium]|nr:IscS subfamily cysteine desulfurase [Candidatus Saccharimonadales bacterium]
MAIAERVYLDHAATTPLDPEVAELMARVLRDVSGNPSSIYAEGRAARAVVDQARDEVAAAIGAEAREIIFTSGGTEADNLAIRGVLKAARSERDHLVTTAIEHHAVLDTARDLEAHAHVRLTILPVDPEGRVSPAAVGAVADTRTALVSVMHGNKEIGTLQPISEIGALCRVREIPFHSDAVQTVGAVPFDVRSIPVDLVSVNAHKFYGPKGVGALYVRTGTRISTMQTGGGQEKGRRPGTENVAGIAGLGAALRLAAARRDREAVRQTALRDRLIAGVLARIPDVAITGHRSQRLPNNASFCFRGTQGEALIVALDLAGFAASSGSACTSGSTEPSHVLLALGLDRDLAQGSLRLSVGHGTTEAEVDALLAALPPIVARLRAVSSVTA